VVLGTVGVDQSASFFDERAVEFCAHRPLSCAEAAVGNRIVLAELSRRRCGCHLWSHICSGYGHDRRSG
jgi:hypothetical protein